nr:hypothetical protein [Ruegeria sp. EL01]
MFQLFVSCGQSSHVFHPAEETLDKVALCVDAGIMRDGDAGV